MNNRDIKTAFRLIEATESPDYRTILEEARSGGDSVITETVELLLEAEVNFIKAQFVVLYDMATNDPKIEAWGQAHYPNWGEMDTKTRVNSMATVLNKMGGLSSARGRANLNHKSIGPNTFDIPDVIDSNDSDQIVKSSLGELIRQAFYNALEGYRSDFG